MLFLLLMAALTGDAQSAATASGPAVITQPDWRAKPTADDVAVYYPEEAAAKRLEGRATIGCRVSAEGLLVDCAAVSEEPAGEGFGKAAVAMSTKFAMQPMTKDGMAVAGGTVRIPIRFVAPPMPPGFRRMPTGMDLAQAYPERARVKNIAGEAVIECGIELTGDLSDCALVREQPVNYAFGQAALSLAPAFNVEPKMRNGVPVRGGAVTIPVHFGPPK